MGETNNVYPNLTSHLSNDQQFRLNKINEVRDYFVAEIKERDFNFYRINKKAIKNNKK